MVHIFYYRSDARMQPGLFQSYLDQLPPFIQKKVLKFKHWQDAERTLAGNILLMKGFQSLNFGDFQLEKLQYTQFQKPYFDDHHHFNISHSGRYTICAISLGNAVGIDVEEIKEIPLGDFTDFFYREEWEQVLNSPEKIRAFYALWTKKESFLKVIGSGLNTPLNKVVIEKNKIRWQDADWFLKEIQLDSSHVCFICTNSPQPSLQIERITL